MFSQHTNALYVKKIKENVIPHHLFNILLAQK